MSRFFLWIYNLLVLSMPQLTLAVLAVVIGLAASQASKFRLDASADSLVG